MSITLVCFLRIFSFTKESHHREESQRNKNRQVSCVYWGQLTDSCVYTVAGSTLMGATCLKSKVCSCGTKFGNLSQEIKMDVHFCIVHFCTQSSYKKKHTNTPILFVSSCMWLIWWVFYSLFLHPRSLYLPHCHTQQLYVILKCTCKLLYHRWFVLLQWDKVIYSSTILNYFWLSIWQLLLLVTFQIKIWNWKYKKLKE